MGRPIERSPKRKKKDMKDDFDQYDYMDWWMRKGWKIEEGRPL